jgi:hypothetical protein
MRGLRPEPHGKRLEKVFLQIPPFCLRYSALTQQCSSIPAKPVSKTVCQMLVSNPIFVMNKQVCS